MTNATAPGFRISRRDIEVGMTLVIDASRFGREDFRTVRVAHVRRAADSNVVTGEDGGLYTITPETYFTVVETATPGEVWA